VPPSGIDSDGFNAAVLDTGLWNFVDRVGDGQLVITGKQLDLSVPAGTSHDVWTADNIVSRIMQTTADEDFVIEVKFELAVSAKYQLQGQLVGEDAGELLRFDFLLDRWQSRRLGCLPAMRAVVRRRIRQWLTIFSSQLLPSSP